MEFANLYSTIESHAAGEPLRIVTGGVPLIPGATILARRQWLRDHLDHVRRALMHEPRGHADMYGCYVTPPVTPQADLGVIFMHNEGYSTMCGHGIIALSTVAVETGMVARPAEPGEVRIGWDTPAGFVEAWAQWDGQRVVSVRFRNVPSFLFHRDLAIETPSFGALVVDVAFGGAFYAYLDGAQAGLPVRPTHLRELIQLGDEVKHATMRALDVVHPLEPELHGIYGTIIAGEPFQPDADQANICVFAEREVDRSPTGTGTAGRVAQLYARGHLSRGQRYLNESIIGTRFAGMVVEETEVGSFPAVVPEVSGSGAITGFAQWVITPSDPVGGGFFLR